MIEVQVERDIVVEAYILCIDRVTVYYTRCKRDDPAALAPKEETDLVPHPAPQIAEILLRQLLEVQFRARINLEIQWIDLRDYRRHVVDDAHLEWGGSCRRLKLLAQLLAGRTVKRALRVILEALIINTKPGHGEARNARESVVNQTVEGRSVARRELFEYDQPCPEPVSMCCNG